MSRAFRIAIVGGGISGLATAYYLLKQASQQGAAVELSILEKGDRLGGVIRTEHREGFLLEAGPEGWASYKFAATSLIRELGLGGELIGSNDHLRKTLVVGEDGLGPFPEGMMFLSPVEALPFWRTAPLSVRGKLRASLEPFVSRSSGELSIREFFDRRLGLEFTDRIVVPLISAIYGGDAGQLSAQSALPELYRAEQKYGSLWRGLRRFVRRRSEIPVLYSMRRGMGQIIERLEHEIRGTRVLTGLSNLRLVNANGEMRLRGDSFEAAFDLVALCAPAPSCVSIIGKTLPRAAGLLEEIPYSSSTLVYLGYRRAEFAHPLNGFGFIVASKKASFLDACTWASSKFSGRCPDDSVLLRCAIHGTSANPVADTEEEVVEKTHREISRLLGVDCDPVLGRVFQVRKAIPQFLLGHSRRLDQLQQELARTPSLLLGGAFFGGVGVAECIRTGQLTASKALSLIESSKAA